ncbi:MAG: hypothetical protein QOJ42_1469 [Acidobacteriaceae bacterium]|jgi:hypothetical protein|nr:hypothetical protein [Acidobacteriaceae bacterium]
MVVVHSQLRTGMLSSILSLLPRVRTVKGPRQNDEEAGVVN